MSSALSHFIDGDHRSCSGQMFGDIINPATAEIIGQVPFATDSDIEAAINAAKAASPAWSSTSALKRARILFKYKELLEKHTDDIAKLVTLEHGKILDDARGSVARGIEVVEFFCGIPHLLKGQYSENVSTNMDCYTIKQPLGICLGITPFNFPVMLPLWMCIPAIACGNTFILKPSEQDPSAPMLLAELFKEAGLLDGVFNIVHGDRDVVDKLLQQPDIAAVSFVGSSAVAKSVQQKAIDNGKRAHAFGSAKNHAIVMPDADLDEASNAICTAAYGSAGERCMAISVAVVVGNDRADDLIAKLTPQIQQLKIKDGFEASADMGPLISKTHLERVKQYIDQGVNEGAKLLIDGREFYSEKLKNGFFLGPSLFDHVKPAMQSYQAEIFGPVLAIIRVESFDQALQIINNNPFGNGTCIFTRDGDAARCFAEKVQVGMVGINVAIPVPVAYHTFGGWKQSFYGDCQLHSEESVRFYTKQKSITQRWPKTEISNSYTMPTN